MGLADYRGIPANTEVLLPGWSKPVFLRPMMARDLAEVYDKPEVERNFALIERCLVDETGAPVLAEGEANSLTGDEFTTIVGLLGDASGEESEKN